MTDNAPKAPEKTCFASFNFCFWAKLIVAIPALPAIGYMASLPFTDVSMKIAAALAMITLATYAAIKVDRIPALSKKIVDKK